MGVFAELRAADKKDASGYPCDKTPGVVSSTAIVSCAAPLKAAVERGIFDPADEVDAPVALFYDLDLWDSHVSSLKASFGTMQHRMAIKSCPLSRLLKYAYEAHGVGIECASMGEVKLAMDHCKIPASHLVFDSPAKTLKELEFSLEHGIHTNLDNFVEYERAKKIVAESRSLKPDATGYVGMRVNPLVGAGAISALSVSTSDSKFGVPVTQKERLLRAYAESPWMTSLHVHIGSGGMGLVVLTAGLRALVDLAQEINRFVERDQVRVLDIGGGLPANYESDQFRSDKVPTYGDYAAHLRQEVPELFSGEFFQVVTEFGQSLFAKSGFLASRVEWLKGTQEKPIAVVHFGADLCVRQAYTKEHKRRVEAYRADGTDFAPGTGSGSEIVTRPYQVAGPLCFQGDFVAHDVDLPSELKEGDILVLKDAGSNTLSMHSRHCSRLSPPVYGYRVAAGGGVDFLEIKPRETLQQLYDFWGPI